jgi:small subunit ribosomal protein S6
MVILLPELAEEDLTAAIDQVSAHVGSINGEVREILKDSPWGRRRLAYTIRFNGQDYRDGYYVIWHFSADPGSLSDLERELKLDTRVIRYLLVLEDPKWGSPQEREAARELAEAPEAEPVATAPAVTAEESASDEGATAEQPAEVAEATTEEAPATEASEPVAETDTETPADVATEEPAVEAEADVPAAEATDEAEAPADTETSEENQ